MLAPTSDSGIRLLSVNDVDSPRGASGGLVSSDGTIYEIGPSRSSPTTTRASRNSKPRSQRHPHSVSA